METETLRRYVLDYQNKQSSLKELLISLQNENALTEKEVYLLFKQYNIPLHDIESCVKENNELEIKTYKPKIIQICNGSMCSYKRSPAIMAYLAEQKDFDIQTTECLGQCSSGPIGIVNGETFVDINQNFAFKMTIKRIRDEK